MADCSVAGVWDRVHGAGNYSDQEFYATSISILCSLLTAVTAGGGGGGGTTQVYFTASPPAAPADPAAAAIWYPPSGGAFKQWNGTAFV